jgi:DNA-binding LacI/PurR family transcriptional regulator
MISAPATLEIPRRASLSHLAADTIRRSILEATWTEFLPSERRLCEMLHVSRPTVRAALHQLAKERLIEIRQGRRNRVLVGSRSTAQSRRRLVGLITSEPVSQMAFVTFQGISELRANLAEQGIATEVLVCAPAGARAQRRKLEAFIQRHRIHCGVLLSVSKAIQLWFQQHEVPALVLGSCHPDVSLPSLDADYRSVCRHAAGIFLRRGHRRIALVLPDSGVAGDLVSEQGFREAIEQHKSLDAVRATVVRHNGTADHISMKLDALFSSAHAPTALLVAKNQHIFAVLIYLLKRGLTVPDTVSFIARDRDHVFATVSPPISHYTMDQNTYIRRLSRLTLQMVNQSHLKPEPNLIFPKYFAGGTVKQIG